MKKRVEIRGFRYGTDKEWEYAFDTQASEAEIEQTFLRFVKLQNLDPSTATWSYK